MYRYTHQGPRYGPELNILYFIKTEAQYKNQHSLFNYFWIYENKKIVFESYLLLLAILKVYELLKVLPSSTKVTVLETSVAELHG